MNRSMFIYQSGRGEAGQRAEMAVLDPEAVAAAPSVPEDAWEGGGTMAAAQQLQRQLAMNPFRAAWLVISVEFNGKQTIEVRFC